MASKYDYGMQISNFGVRQNLIEIVVNVILDVHLCPWNMYLYKKYNNAFSPSGSGKQIRVDFDIFQV